MKRTNYALWQDSYVTMDAIHNTKSYMTQEELKEMDTKMHQIVSPAVLGTMTAAELSLAQKLFTIGYLSAHIDYPSNA